MHSFWCSISILRAAVGRRVSTHTLQSWIMYFPYFSTKNDSFYIIPLSTSPTKWSNTIKQFIGKLPANCLSVFDHFVKLALKGLSSINRINGFCTMKSLIRITNLGFLLKNFRLQALAIILGVQIAMLLTQKSSRISLWG